MTDLMQIHRNRLAADEQIFNLVQEDGVYACPFDDNSSKWYAIILGPEQTPWQNGVFLLSIEFDTDEPYPFNHPTIKFISQMYHPNIYKDGRICLDVLKKDWKPIYTLQTVLMMIRSLLCDPNPESPANHDAASTYSKDRHLYEMNVRQCVVDSLEMLPIICQTIGKNSAGFQ